MSIRSCLVAAIAVLALAGCSERTVTTSPVDAPAAKGPPVPIPLPTRFIIGNPYPNPFSVSCIFNVTIPRAQTLVVVIRNPMQVPIRTLFSGSASAGIHMFTWDGRNDWGEQCADGFYFISAGPDSFPDSPVVRLKH